MTKKNFTAKNPQTINVEKNSKRRKERTGNVNMTF